MPGGWSNKRESLPVDEVVRLRQEESWTGKEIGERYGCSKTVIMAVLKDAGITGRLPKGKKRAKKKCNHCGRVYVHCEYILGLPKCPACWGFESYTQVGGNGNNGNGRSQKAQRFHDSMAFKASIGLDGTLSYHPDTGCSLAHSVVGHPVTCQQCPFVECIDVLKDNGKVPRHYTSAYIMARRRQYLEV